ncbi:nucleotidyltransferase domain-containing protein [Endozoicomonas sp. Mp262]|uniref:nucleotidyltransferase domain-containing protein n=1 Tax=Endozoicomonas sp. Mp262 TaxID=2919499 RepID=UPI0021D9A4A6
MTMESQPNQPWGLKPDDIEKIRNVFRQFPVISQVILYGSRAMGNYRHGSDIDLTLVGVDQQPLGLTTVNCIDEALDELMLPYTIDLSDRASLENPALIDHVRRVGVTFYRC